MPDESPSEPGHDGGAQPADDAGRGARYWVSRFAAVGCVGTLIAMWAWIFAGGAGVNTESRIDDSELTATAEAICAPYRADVLELPPAFDASGLEDRAEVLSAANALLADQVNDLHRELDPTSDKDVFLVEAFLDDWDAYLDARVAHAERLHSGDDGPIGVPGDRGGSGRPIDKRMTDFANVNRMPSCAPPGDV